MAAIVKAMTKWRARPRAAVALPPWMLASRPSRPAATDCKIRRAGTPALIAQNRQA